MNHDNYSATWSLGVEFDESNWAALRDYYLEGALNPFSVNNFEEAISQQMDDAFLKQVSSLLALNKFDEAGKLLSNLSINYWKEIAEKKADEEYFNFYGEWI